MAAETAGSENRGVATAKPAWLRYGVAVLAVAIVAAIRILGRPVLAEGIPWILSAPAIMVVAWYGGIGPGLVATALSALAVDYLLLPPIGSVGITNASQVIVYGVFAVTGVFISLLADRAQAAHADLEQTTRHLREGEAPPSGKVGS